MAVDVALAGAAFYRGNRGLDPEIVGLLFDARHFAEMVSPLFFAVFLACAAVVALGRGALPRRLGWAAAAIAALTPVMLPMGYEPSQIPVFLTVFWIVAVSVVLLRRRGTLATGS